MCQTELKLRISPDEVKELLAPQLEEYRGISRFSIEKEWKKDFWGEADNHYFKMRRKSRSRGYTNSYALWLGGEIRQTEYGSLVKIWFYVDKEVTCLEKVFDFILYGFTLVFGISILIRLIGGIYNAMSGQANLSDIFDTGLVMPIIVFSGMWGVRYIVKRLGAKYGEKEEIMMVQFLKDLFSQAQLDKKDPV